MTDFKKLLQVLVENNAEFVLIGGAAAIAHGSSRLTQDLDIVYRRSAGNYVALAKALAPYRPYLRGAPAGLPFLWDAETLKKGLNFTLATTIGEIDLMGEIIGGGNYENLKDRTISLTLFDVECRCLDLETLIEVKKAAGRPKDLEAIAELEALLS